MDILFVADPLASFKIYKDSTFVMMREAQRRGHAIWACETQDLSWRSGGVVQAPMQHILLQEGATLGFGCKTKPFGPCTA